ncbi:MAG TPA: hypothetical protein VJ946_08000 [Bacteroidales bacterium]|nr:hypothetical protein [Bacteroidales bacterium]
MTKAADLTKNGACPAIDKTIAVDLLFNPFRVVECSGSGTTGFTGGYFRRLSDRHVEAFQASFTSPA